MKNLTFVSIILSSDLRQIYGKIQAKRLSKNAPKYFCEI